MDYSNTECQDLKMTNTIYQTKEMKTLHPLSRVEIILVGEKLKPSATIHGDENTELILKKLGMKYVITKTHDGGFVADITYDGNIHEHNQNIRDSDELLFKEEQQQKEKTEQEMAEDYRNWQINAPHEFIGNMYGYPKCCIEAYSNHMRTGIFSVESVTRDQIPEELYCISHTPCSLDCKVSLELGRKCMDTLERIDPEALRALIYFNKNGSLES